MMRREKMWGGGWRDIQPDVVKALGEYQHERDERDCRVVRGRYDEHLWQGVLRRREHLCNKKQTLSNRQ